MDYLKKEKTLIERDETGNVLPVEVTLELLPEKPSAKLIPLLKGEIQRLYNPANEDVKSIDEEIILNHCIEPKYEKEEIKFIRPDVFGALVTAILSISIGVSQEDIKKSTSKVTIEKAEAASNFI